MGNCFVCRLLRKASNSEAAKEVEAAEFEADRVTIRPNPDARFQRESVLVKARTSVENENFEETKEAMLLRKRQQTKSIPSESFSSNEDELKSDQPEIKIIAASSTDEDDKKYCCT